jgi:peptidyl-prolyl cis-trans isomerase D
MALIGTLRNKMGMWAAIFVFVAISAFVLNDLLGNNSVLLGSNDVGEIAGHSVSLEEFQQAVKDREASYFLSTNRQPGDREMPTLRQQAWEMLILRYAIQKEFEKVGVKVTVDEVEDMIYGKNVDANVRQSFTNPQTGQFDQQMVVNYLQQLNSMPEDSEPRVRWEIFQRDLAPGRQRIKYENLLIKSTYVTTAEAAQDYHLQNDVAEIKYLYIPYHTVSETEVTPTDADFREYYNKNKEKFKSENTRDIKFVTFPVVASSDDTLAVREDLNRLINDFKATQNDSAFATLNSDNPATAYIKYNVSNVPTFISQADLVTGNLIGPFEDNGSFKVVKVTKAGADTLYNARASHILIRWDSETPEAKQAAREKARGILKDIKGGASFAAKASEFGTDGTAGRGGDLGWFPEGEMVKPFNDAVFGATKKGLLNDVVETEFGYHIIEITEVKNNLAYTLATIEREIAPSDASINEALRKAELFAADLSGEESFKKRAEEGGLTVYDGKTLTAGERRITNLGEAREIVQWLFRDAETGKVSQVFELPDLYVVAVMTGEIEKGYKPLDAIKEEITQAVTNEVKGKKIIEKLKSLSGSLDEIATKFGADAVVSSISDLKLNSNALGSAGFDPRAVGIAFSLEGGKRSQPYAGENGVLLIETQNKTVAPEIADYAVYRAQLEQSALNRNMYNIAEAIKDKANIEDKRYKYY